MEKTAFFGHAPDLLKIGATFDAFQRKWLRHLQDTRATAQPATVEVTEEPGFCGDLSATGVVV